MAIEGVKTKKLRVIPDERGRLMEMLRCDDEVYQKFGQVYMTTVYPGVTKAWHYHTLQTDNVVAVKGMIKLVLYDHREDSSTHRVVQEFFIGEHNPLLVQIPPMVCHGFKGISPEEAIIVNCCTEPYNHEKPDELRLDAHTSEIPYDWAREDH